MENRGKPRTFGGASRSSRPAGGANRSRGRDGDSARGRGNRPRFRKNIAKFVLPKDTKIDYKNLPLLQRYVTERGKIVPRRISGISAQEQRAMSIAIKYARYLGLLSVGSSKKH